MTCYDKSQQINVFFFSLSLPSVFPLCSATPELTSPPPTSQQDQAANEAQASSSVGLDSSQPVTNIQIRLADGGRLVQKFNHTHR